MWRVAYWISAVMLLVFALAAALYQLGDAPLYTYDEALYAELTHQVLQGEVVSPTYAGAPMLEKPPLYVWLAAAVSFVVGEGEFALRLPSALSAVVLVALVMVLGSLSGSRAISLLSGVVLVTSAPFLETARTARLDVLVTLWIVLGIIALITALHKPRYYLLFGLSLALAVMTKSVIAVFALVAVCIVAFWYRNGAWLKEKYFWLGIAVATVLALPWHVLQYLRFGSQFVHDYIFFTVKERVEHNLFPLRSTNLDYVWYLGRFANPWWQLGVLSVPVVGYGWAQIGERVRSLLGVCLSMCAVVLLVFFVSATKAPTYLITLYPFLAVAVACVCVSFTSRLSFLPRIVAVACITILLAVGMFTTYQTVRHLDPYFAVSDALAAEEKVVGEHVRTAAPSRWFVAAGYQELGAIKYYAASMHPLALTQSTTLVQGDVVLVAQKDRTAVALPKRVRVLHDGPRLLVVQVY